LGANVILLFPDVDTFRLALTCGAVPAAVSLAGADGGIDAKGRLWLKPAVPPDAPSLKELRCLGISVRDRSTAALDQPLCCWPQLLPMHRDPRGWSQADKTPVLFELADTTQLSELVSEILRLGNDRQAFRWIDTGEGARALLRVVGPPYYSVLRAIDSGMAAPVEDRQSDHAPFAYREAGPRVWVQLGYTHPLVEHIQAPAGQILLLRHPHDWVLVDEGRFRDIYEVLDFTLPQASPSWRDIELERRITIPLRLAPGGGTTEPTELWVLHDDALAQLDHFVQNADDQLLGRLMFAVGEVGDRKTIVLRVRPSRLPPPVLVLDGVGFRRYLRLPNLFVPCGQRLHPPLRRDAVVKLLAADAGQITWLYPDRGGTFAAESLPDDAFRPLSDWVDYVLDQDRHVLTAWVQANRFEFESFICRDDQPAPSPDPKDVPRRKVKREPEKVDERPEQAGTEPPKPHRATDVTIDEPVPTTTPSELEEKLGRLENAFLEMKSALDAPERQALWPELAQVHDALGHAEDAAICWSNAAWEQSTPPPFWPSLWRDDAPEPPMARIAEIVTNPSPRPADLRALVMFLVRSAHHGTSPVELAPLLGPARQYLNEHERVLGIRLAWLGWEAVNRLADGDVLALARARDRLLERLYLNGLSPDLDLPGFLRFGGAKTSARFHQVHQQMFRLHPMVHRWIGQGYLLGPGTATYVDLLFAFGLARLGDRTHSQKLIDEAPKRLGAGDHVHGWLIQAFEFRILEAMEGRAGVQRLPAELLDRLDLIDRLGRYKIDRLREHSQILEPHEQIDPYRLWHRRFADELSRELARLHDIKDSDELTDRLRRLLSSRGKGNLAVEPRVLTTALELAPRLGEAFARELLEQAARVLEKRLEPLDQALLLEQGLFVAAHYDNKDEVQRLMGRFHRLIEAGGGSLPVRNLEALLGSSFHSLRKLGLRDEVALLLERMARVIEDNPELDASSAGAKNAASNATARLQRLLLQVAAGWFFFGQDDRARPVLDQARALLFKGDLAPAEQTGLACAYVTTLGQAPIELALPRVLELFRKLKGVYDTFTTCSHYSLSRLDVVEAAILSMVSDGFNTTPEARRWLDDDEFLVRRRIHREVKAAMEKAGL
jgi:cellulose synthase operon protein C